MKNQQLCQSGKLRKLLDRVRDVMRLKHCAYRTEVTYLSWIRRFILFHDKKHPKDVRFCFELESVPPAFPAACCKGPNYNMVDTEVRIT
ncbi:MAG: phage integrase N-terminal SAM-like domain-containing protein [Deltaproteobacteria bacterium]|nr:phage integrase N-terminal SAM-like domain-containing protein [Deltaproteobacteria bacterium]MBW2138142.1 phage integrase N-terminal SAM-like domain-containing protein [Deltaproteobacteria bacterium]